MIDMSTVVVSMLLVYIIQAPQCDSFFVSIHNSIEYYDTLYLLSTITLRELSINKRNQNFNQPYHLTQPKAFAFAYIAQTKKIEFKPLDQSISQFHPTSPQFITQTPYPYTTQYGNSSLNHVAAWLA